LLAWNPLFSAIYHLSSSVFFFSSFPSTLHPSSADFYLSFNQTQFTLITLSLLLFSLSIINLIIIMHFALPILAAIMAVDARPQGVTSKISPPGPMISGCLANSDGAFALAVMPIDVKNVKRAPSSTSTLTLTTLTTTTIHPGSTKTVTEEELSTMTPKVTVTPVKSSTSYVVPVRLVELFTTPS